MGVIIRLVVGIIGLLLITAMTMCFGIGGFFFTLGLFAVIFWAFNRG